MAWQLLTTPLRRRGTAYLIVLGVAAVLIVIAQTLTETGTATRRQTIRSANEQKAMDCAEAATNLVYRLVAEDMNDPQMIYDAILLKGLKTESWYWKFRMPQLMAGANVDPVSFKNNSISHADTSGNGLGLEISVGPQMLAKLRKEYKNQDFADLEDLYRDMGGEVTIKSEASIKKMFGILPKSNKYEIPGITFDLTEFNNLADLNVGNFLNSIMSDQEFKIDLTEQLLSQMPDINFGDVVYNVIKNININLALEAVAVPIPIGRLVGALLKGMISKLGSGATLKGFLRETLLKDLKLEIDLTDFKNSIRNKILGILPDEIRTLAGQVNWGVTVEKVGVFEVKTTVEYQPQGPRGPTIKKVLLTQRDFRVADVQPIAPDYTFFVANTALLFEDEAVENAQGFKGDEQINWAEGMGSLVCHNITFFDAELFKNLKNFFGAIGSGDIEKLANSYFLPGRVRVNGTKPMEVRLNFGLLDFLGSQYTFTDALRGCEVAALLINNKDKNKHREVEENAADKPAKLKTPDPAEHPFMPTMGESLYGTSVESPPPLGGWVALFNILEGYLERLGAGQGLGLSAGDFMSVPVNALKLPHFDWPWLTDGFMWIPVPKFYNKTYFFGDFHCEFPLSMRVEGNLWKRFSRVRLPMIRIFIPLNWLFGCPNVDITLPPLPFQTNVVEPYGFCSHPPLETSTGEVDAERMKKEWDPNDKKNLPANVYSPMQYLKKASYYYATTADFSKDIENRSTEMDIPGVGRKMVFNCDGVTFVECTDGQGLFFRNDLWVCGRGMIVAAGNIHLKSIRRVDPPGGPPTMLSIVARNGALINNGKNVVEACLYGDRGLMNPFYGSLKIYGNLVVNQFKRSDCQGKIDIHFQANRTHSSLLSYFKDIAKYDPTRYQATFSKKWRVYEFLKN
ncbi:MAG: hypothetical protein OZSIB_0122 [Candidatus Ozemobacter sibiricus]|uniref:Uncharacterized protein n=1 Tax=Candidatus Ozemobacter sibiricus TaxID=2268124 RepID=A0A367ZPG2_9BACT|nr:MAG: hypothetical protein OZSIB_0122 [Candidatus Ozemobacter sibiricus]